MGRGEGGGRPTKYKEQYCEDIISFFDRPLTRINGNGKEVGCDFPTFPKFAADIRVHKYTLIEWTRVHPTFSDSYDIARQLQENILVTNTMNGHYPQAFAIFIAKNTTDMRDQTDVVAISAPIDSKDRDDQIKKLMDKAGDGVIEVKGERV